MPEQCIARRVTLNRAIQSGCGFLEKQVGVLEKGQARVRLYVPKNLSSYGLTGALHHSFVVQSANALAPNPGGFGIHAGWMPVTATIQ